MPKRTLNTILTLSAAPGPDLELARESSYVDRELRRIERMRRHHLAAAADLRERRLLDYIRGAR